MNDNITDEQRQALGWIVEAAGRNGLGLLEVSETKTGNPAVLLVAMELDEDGSGGGRMAPLARLDINMDDFTPPEGVDQVAKTEEDASSDIGVQCEDECADVCNNREEDDEEIYGVGC